MRRLRTQYLTSSRTHAVIERDPLFAEAHILSIGGAEQSHVNLGEPGEITYEYLRRAANVVDLIRPGEPLRALHLGAGGLTLPRYIAHTRPGSEQIAVDIDAQLMDFVLAELPLAQTGISVRIGDARSSLAAITGTFEVIMLDIFSGEDAPAHLTESEYYAELAELLTPGGVLLVNIGDDPPLRFASTQMRAFSTVFALSSTAALADARMFGRTFPGNIVLAGRADARPDTYSPGDLAFLEPAGDPWPDAWLAQLRARGPHPAGVLVGDEVRPLLALPQTPSS